MSKSPNVQRLIALPGTNYLLTTVMQILVQIIENNTVQSQDSIFVSVLLPKYYRPAAWADARQLPLRQESGRPVTFRHRKVLGQPSWSYPLSRLGGRHRILYCFRNSYRKIVRQECPVISLRILHRWHRRVSDIEDPTNRRFEWVGGSREKMNRWGSIGCTSMNAVEDVIRTWDTRPVWSEMSGMSQHQLARSDEGV